MTDENYEWYVEADLNKYKGRWIAIAHKQIIAHGNNAKVVLENALKKFPNEMPALAKVPKEDADTVLHLKMIEFKYRKEFSDVLGVVYRPSGSFVVKNHPSQMGGMI